MTPGTQKGGPWSSTKVLVLRVLRLDSIVSPLEEGYTYFGSHYYRTSLGGEGGGGGGVVFY